MPIAISSLSTQLTSLKGGSAYYYDELGPKQKISIKGLGELTFPLNPIQVRALIEKAHVAPFGKGHETLVDRSVRNTWEIDADQLGLSSAKLRKSLKAFLANAAAEMNVGGEIKAEPYKLLLYEKGGFFAEHQDSEKLPGMFGTLLVGLPSAHEGGRLLIDPGDGERVVVDFAEDNATSFPAVAFFADRKHEIEPVTSGYRVVLVFNLVRADGGTPPKVDRAAAAKALVPTLAGLGLTDPPLCLALSHQYTDTNFSTGQLKGDDAVRVAVLREAAALAGLNIRVGLIEEHTSAGWENADDFGQGYGYGYRSRRSRYGYDYDDAPVSGEPKNFAQVEVGEYYEGHLFMSNWLPEDGTGIGQLNLDKEDIITPPDRPEEDPIDWSVEGYQGNWGMTTEFTYRHAGIMIWHPAAEGQIVAKMPLNDRLEWLRKQTAKPRNPAVTSQLERVLTTIAETVNNSRYSAIDFTEATGLIIKLGKMNPTGSEAIFTPWLPVFTRDFAKVKPSFWPEAVKVFGVDLVAGLLRQLMEEGKSLSYRDQETQPPVVMATIHALIGAKEEHSIKLGEACLSRLPEYLQPLPERSQTSSDYVRALLKLADQQPDHALWANVSTINQLLPKLRNPQWIRKTLAPTLVKEKTGGFLLTELLTDLRARTASPPTPYADFSRPLPEGMEAPSGKFREVLLFLQHPKQETFDFKHPEAARAELSRYLGRHQLDVKETTIRTRPSHTLRLTKTTASYQRRAKQYTTDLKLYEELAKHA